MIVREMTPRDRRYVVPTWAQSARYGLSKRDRFRLVDRILDDGATCIVLATNDVTVHAWACGGHDVLHYVYVPPELRSVGLAKRCITLLFGQYPERIRVTHEWPRESARFRYQPHHLTRIAA